MLEFRNSNWKKINWNTFLVTWLSVKFCKVDNKPNEMVLNRFFNLLYALEVTQYEFVFILGQTWATFIFYPTVAYSWPNTGKVWKRKRFHLSSKGNILWNIDFKCNIVQKMYNPVSVWKMVICF